MKGFIYLFSILSDSTFPSTGTGSISNVHDCTLAGVTTCNLCDVGYNNNCLNKASPQIIETWTLANNAGFATDKITATVNTASYSLARNSDRTEYPLSLYNLGYVFGYEV